MTKQILIWIVTILIGLSDSYGQTFDTACYSTGKIKEIKEYQNNQIIRATRFKNNGKIAYKWDIDKKILESYYAITYQDTLAEYFKKNCPNYTKYKHYGNGPLMEIENYKDNKRHREYEKYTRNGELVTKGQFDNWKKAGIWTYYDSNGNRDRHIHWFHHNYYEGGISIDYTVIPITLTSLILIGLLFLFVKFLTYSTYYIGYSILTIGLYALLIISGFTLNEMTLIKIQLAVSNYVFPVLLTFTIGMILLSLGAIIFRKRAKVRFGISITFLTIGIGLGLFLYYLYIMSRFSSAALLLG